MSEAVTDSIISVESVLIEAPRIDVIELITADSVTDSINTVEFTEAVTVETIESESIVVEIVEVAQQGPRGIQGIQGSHGPIGDASGALLVTNRLNEFSTSQMKIEARTNIELEHIDCGVFL